MMNATPTGSVPPDEILAMDRAAFDRTASARAAMKPEEAPRYTLDASHAVAMALGTATKVAPYRARMLALPEFDILHLDGMEDQARGLRFANREILRRIEGAKALPGIADEGWDLRDLLMRYADALAKKALINPKLIVQLKEGSGYADLAEDLTVLVGELESLPASYVGQDTLVTRAELARAVQIGHQISTAMGVGSVIDLSQAALLEARKKLGALLVRSHSQVRRALAFLRWDEGDAAELAPSLYVAGPGRPKAKPEAPQDLAALHEELHEHMTPPLAPEDNPFAEE